MALTREEVSNIARSAASKVLEGQTTCISAGITLFRDQESFRRATPIIFRVNLKGLVSEDDLKIPHSELAIHVGAAGKDLIAFAFTGTQTGIATFDRGEGKCGTIFGREDELFTPALAAKVKEMWEKRGPGNPGSNPGKEPWQMTAKEYAKSMSTLEDRYNELLKIELKGEEYDPNSPVGREASQSAFGQLKKETGLIGLTFTDMAGMGHTAKVRLAIEEGKPVPPEVLAEYPELTKGSNPGKYMTITDPSRTPFKVDRGIADLVTKLNKAGYKTATSCSGMRENHPRGPRILQGYLSFEKKDLTAEQQEEIKTAARAVGMEVRETPSEWEEYVGGTYRGKASLAIYTPENEGLQSGQFLHKFEQALFSQATKGSNPVGKLAALREILSTKTIEEAIAIKGKYRHLALTPDELEVIDRHLNKLKSESNPGGNPEEWKLRESIRNTVYGLREGVSEEEIRKHLTRNPQGKYWYEPEEVDYILKRAGEETGNPESNPGGSERARILWTHESTQQRIEILESLGLDKEYFASPWSKLPPDYRDKLVSYYEVHHHSNPGEYVTITDPGKTTFKPGEIVSREAFEKENERVRKLGEKPATGK